MLMIAAAAQAENLVFNGDFEAASAQNPPPGWTMWGASMYKDPANFTLDTANPHGGTACLRIHHPANTAGYIVSSPEHALRTRKGMMYTVSFRARAAKPGRALFGFDAYEDVTPFVGAPSPGFFALEVGPQWKAYTFTVHEGWDFFAGQTRLLLLVFKATTATAEEQTLWVADVAAVETPSPREGRLLERSELVYPPLEHRLRPGAQLEFTVDAAKRLRRATRDAGGVSFHRVAGWTGQPYDKQGEYALAPELEQAIREMRLPMTRFYAVGDEPFGLEPAIDKAAEMCRRAGVPLDHTVLEFETQGATRTLAPEVWARGIQHSLKQGYGFRHWEITNEPYVAGAKAAFPTPDAYVEHFLAASAAIRRVHPQGQVGLAISGRDTAWGNYVLKRAAGHYDFVAGHFYCFMDINKSKFEDVALRANYETLDDVLRVNALLRAYNPGRDVYQYDTEWGMHGSGPGGERPDAVNRNGNIFGAMHRAVRLIHYTREDILRGASSWEMFSRLKSPGFGFLYAEAPGRRSMLYWLYYHFNRHVGEWVLDTDGTAPYYEWSDRGKARSGPLTPALATLSADGKRLYLVIANGSWAKDAECRVILKSFQAARATAAALSQSDPEASPLVDRKEDAVRELPVALGDGDLRCTVPAHAIVFIAVESKAAG
jgi:hypothetical protein